MSNGNLRVLPPYGDIFAPNVGATQRVAQQLYAEQRQREAQQAAANKALDDEFAKNMAGIRDVDVPDLTKAYGDWKMANQQILKKREATPEEQLAVLRKKADIYKVINGSKSLREREMQLRKLGDTHPDNLVDEWQDMLAESIRTPLSKGQGIHDRDYNYNGGNYDIGGANMKLRGSKKDVEGEKKLSEDKLSYEVPVYQTFDVTPEAFKQNVLGKMSERKAQKAYIYSLRNLPADELVRTDAEFKAIPESVWKNIGLKKPDLTVKNPLSEAEQAANYYAQKHAIDMATVAVQPYKTRKETNQDELMKRKRDEGMADKKELARYNSNLIEGRQRRNPYSGVNYQEGILFDTIGETNPVSFQSGKPKWAGGVSGKIINGYAYDENDKPVTGDIEIDAADLPSLMISVLKEQKVNVPTAGKVKFTAKDGTITTLKTGTTGQVDRNAMKVYQLFKNKEPIKGEQPNFGKTNNIPQPAKKTNEPASNKWNKYKRN